MSLASWIFISITKLLKTGKTPLISKSLEKLPLYLPDKSNGPSEERSRMWEGHTYHKILQIMPLEWTTSSMEELDKKNAAYNSTYVTET